jgi:hypothetical protein
LVVFFSGCIKGMETSLSFVAERNAGSAGKSMRMKLASEWQTTRSISRPFSWYPEGMATVVNLDPDVEKRLREEARNRNVAFDRVLNEAVRSGLATSGANKGQPFVQKTYSMGSNQIDLTHALALADELEDEETIRKMKLAEERAKGQ